MWLCKEVSHACLCSHLDWQSWFVFFKSSPEDIFIDSRERGRVKEKEKHQCEREISISCLPHAPWPGFEPATWVCVLTGNRISNLLVVQDDALSRLASPGQLIFWEMQFSWENTIFSMNSAGTIEYSFAENTNKTTNTYTWKNFNLYLIPYRKINLKWIIFLNANPKL